MRARVPAACVLICLVLASDPSAQYGEPSVAELSESSVGASSELFGWAVASLDDVNHDGFVDFAVSAPFHSFALSSSIGRVYVLSGADGSQLWSKRGAQTSEILGYSLEAMDWNGDGVQDVVTGGPFAGNGRVLILSGTNGATLAELTGSAASDGFGASLAGDGDFDGDGQRDLLVAAPFVDTTVGADAGRLYVYRAGSTAPFTTIDGPHANAELGVGLAYVGNTSPPLDAKAELVVGHRDATSFFDGFAALYEWNGTAPALRYTVSGVGMGFDLMGDRIDGGGNVNGDGFHDFLVGDMFHDEVEVFSGSDGSLLRVLDGAGEGGRFGAACFLLDLQGDGPSEIAVGAWQNDSGATRSGKVFVYSGANGAILSTITPTTANVRLGIDVRPHGDLNGDGKDDLLVGAYGQGFGGPRAGAALVFSGHVPAPQNLVRPAQRATDPLLADVGGDPTAGPIAGSPIEVFNVSLDCRNAPASGPFAIRLRLANFASPFVTPHGWIWIGGTPLFQINGVHTRNVVTAVPGGFALPNDFGLWDLVYGAQGSCGGRFSNALVQTIGR